MMDEKTLAEIEAEMAAATWPDERAAAWRHLPALVAEVRRLRAALTTIRDIEIYVAGRPCSCSGVGCVECVARVALDGGELHS